MAVEVQTKTTFEDVQRAINEVPNINLGGCGIAALAMARWIKKNNSNFMTYLFVMGHNDSESFKLNSEVLANATKLEPTSATHVGLIMYDYMTDTQRIVDCNTVYNMLSYDYVNTFHDEDLLIRAINRIDHWNPAFSRRHVATIARVLDIDLSDIDCRTQREYQDNAKKLPTSPNGVQRKDNAADKETAMSVKDKFLRKFLKLIKT
jgi:hypothetical protein